MRLLLATTIAVSLVSSVFAEVKSVEIPLKEVWALGMPHTRDISELDAKLNRANLTNQQLRKQSLVEGIRHTLRDRAPEGQSCGPGFVVVGTDKEALKNAHAVFIERKRDPERWLPPDTYLSLVFYAHLTGRYIWISSIEREGNVFMVKYGAVAHSTANATNHFALIPIGKLPEGTYKVKFKETPTLKPNGEPAPPLRESRRFISDSFSFVVRK
jgi:hypothetical protein